MFSLPSQACWKLERHYCRGWEVSSSMHLSHRKVTLSPLHLHQGDAQIMAPRQAAVQQRRNLYMPCSVCTAYSVLRESLLGKSKATCKLRAKSSQHECRSQAQNEGREPGVILHRVGGWRPARKLSLNNPTKSGAKTHYSC